ncbi:MAG: hypothetical protein ABS45_10130 [Comamonas sp. SCN 65-56]|mgnify:CR=1 FL=1|uniref:GGDEF domain-containing protein n=1 Tax=Comamonas sp. SCN 65-56 TaxID=1660095 RepID=UPI0008687E51|nr:GGDEF domain-containing protein [Comamonas sp. SCN 65-56]ODS91722.1 MAG: hypothetical protein ABS45_10130 [Comamonas sp. SCN 65-56]
MAPTPLLHVPTMLLMDIVASTLMAAAIVAVQPRRREGMGLWASAMALHALVFTLFVLRGQISDWISIVLANVLLSAVLALLLGAVAQFHHRPLPRWQMALPVAAVALLLSLLLGNYHARVLVVSYVLSLQLVLIVWALWRPTAPEHRRSAVLLSVPLVLQGVLLLGRGLWFTWQGAGQRGLLADGPEQILTFLSAFIFVVLASLAFILLVKERADAINQRLARFDPLTGLANRRLLEKGLVRDTARAIRTHEAYAVLMIDIDHFKAVNDQHGHLAGDAVLRHVAHLLTQRLRAPDIAGRWGGEEFMVLLPVTPEAGALRVAQALRQSVEQTPCLYRGRSIAVTISIGACAEFLLAGDTPEQLVDGADQALYAAKESGRNRVVSRRLHRA